jgi:hypothetical protein
MGNGGWQARLGADILLERLVFPHALCVEISRANRFSANYRAKIAGNGLKTTILGMIEPMASSVLKKNRIASTLRTNMTVQAFSTINTKHL